MVNDLEFKDKDVYCGLCLGEDIPDFQKAYPSIKFIDPYWSKKKILDEFVKKPSTTFPTLEPEDLPF